MKLRTILSACAMTFAAVATHPVFAQMNMDHAKMGMAAAPDMTDGEVRKVDIDAGKVTLKHADIKSLDMPAMTMVFAVKDKAMLDKLKTGDRVRFKVINDAGKFTITEIQPAP